MSENSESDTRYLQATNEDDFNQQIAKAERQGWLVESRTSKKDGTGMVYDAELTRPKQK
jgi:hypothetical protein